VNIFNDGLYFLEDGLAASGRVRRGLLLLAQLGEIVLDLKGFLKLDDLLGGLEQGHVSRRDKPGKTTPFFES